MSDSDLRGRLPRPRIALERRPLSNSASTASCSIRFSLRRMTSGARCRISFCSRLLRLITRRYKSFRSEVAKRPPSSGTSGRRSGGITGTTVRIIHSGLLFDCENASISLRRLASFFGLSSVVASAISTRRSAAIFCRSSARSMSRIASAPILAVTLGLERAVVDRFRLLDLAVGPGQNLLRARDRDPDLVEDLRRDLRPEEIHHFLIHHRLLDRVGGPIDRLSGPKFPGNHQPRGL